MIIQLYVAWPTGAEVLCGVSRLSISLKNNLLVAWSSSLCNDLQKHKRAGPALYYIYGPASVGNRSEADDRSACQHFDKFFA